MRRASLSLAAALLLVATHGHAAADAASIIRRGGANPAALACATCHGADGSGNPAAGYPRLAGLAPAYLAKQLGDFRQGTRRNPLMQPIAAALTASETDAVAAAYGALPRAAASRDADPRPREGSGAWIALRGAWDRNVPECTACHGPAGIGVDPAFPPLAGQGAAYLESQLNAWRATPPTRSNDPNGLMQHIAASLTPAEVSAVAAYFGGAGEESVPVAAAPPSRYFQPPAERELPDNAYGALVRRGEAIFVDTMARSPSFVGNRLNCGNCHLDRGRKPDSAPLWAAYTMYPAYRKKNNKVNSFAERMQGCFQFSENGAPPAADGEELNALTAYAYWLSTGAPVGKDLPGRGFDEPHEPAGGYDIGRGAEVYHAQCEICHGPDGDGRSAGGEVVFPPLWGSNSYNWGAGMHRINTAAGFILHNMPLGKGDTLTDQQAWDVAAFVNSHERPQDPRLINHDIEATRLRFHDGDGVNLYGVVVGGVLLGQGAK